MIQVFYAYGKTALIDNSIDLVNDTIKMGILKDTYAVSTTSHIYWDDVSTHEIPAAGAYHSGGATLTNIAITTVIADEESKVDCDDVVLSFSAATMQYLVFYKDTTQATNSPLIAYVDLETPVTYDSEVLSVIVNTDGLIRVV
jgi:hypothetical protein